MAFSMISKFRYSYMHGGGSGSRAFKGIHGTKSKVIPAIWFCPVKLLILTLWSEVSRMPVMG